jgi:hypothetical protein
MKTFRPIFLTMALSIILVSCAQIEALLPPDYGIAPAVSQPTLEPTALVTATPSQTASISPTPTISLTPSVTPTPQPTRTPHPTYTPSVTIPPLIRVGPDNFPDYLNPLTGLPVPNPNLLERRPILVKIPNFPHGDRVRQSGVSLADQVYEYYLEFGLTRFATIFYGNDAVRVGPIRSGRIFDVHLVDMYNAIYVFNSATYRDDQDDPVNTYKYLVSHLNQNLFVVEREENPLYRDNSLSSPNNLFGNTSEISQHITDQGTDNSRPDLASFHFYSLGGYSREWATQVKINYSYASYAYWQFDSASARYLRYQGNVDVLDEQEPSYSLLTDALTGLPIVADNVVVLFVPHKFHYVSFNSNDQIDGEIFDIQLEGSGLAYVFRDGRGYEAEWLRTEKNKPISLLNTARTPFPLKPGITFFQVMSSDTILTRENQTWLFDFVRPEIE